MRLTFLYGTAAAGKLTVARRLSALTGDALFHNHLVVDAVAAVFPLFAPYMYANLGTQWATSVLAFLCVTLIPATLLIYKYGAKIRSWSKFAYNLG